MKRFMTVLFTDGTNRDVDFAKIMGGIALAAFLLISAHSYWKGQLFDPTAWAMGVATIIAAASGVSKIKDFSGNPGHDPTP